jgi:hypothetical protein
MIGSAKFYTTAVQALAEDGYRRLMRAAREGRWPALHCYYLPAGGKIQFVDEDQTVPAGYVLAWPERLPGDRDLPALHSWVAARAGRVPFLPIEGVS